MYIYIYIYIHIYMYIFIHTFNPRNKDAAIEIYLSSLEEKPMSIEIPKGKYNNLTPEERGALFDLKNGKTIVIKGADKGSAVVVWHIDD